MKIYKQITDDSIDTLGQKIDDILINELDIGDKFIGFIEHYSYFIEHPDGFIKLIKSLFTNLGYEIRFSRIGDTNERAEAFCKLNNGKELIIEIEIPTLSPLDASRKLLDDLAIEISRKNKKKEELIPMVLCWSIPNNRVDYWNIVNDIKKVLGIEILTVPLPALALDFWLDNGIQNIEKNYYLTKNDNEMNGLISFLEKENLKEREYQGFLKPLK